MVRSKTQKNKSNAKIKQLYYFPCWTGGESYPRTQPDTVAIESLQRAESKTLCDIFQISPQWSNFPPSSKECQQRHSLTSVACTLSCPCCLSTKPWFPGASLASLVCCPTQGANSIGLLARRLILPKARAWKRSRGHQYKRTS